jgi:hypothetical protein
MNSIQCADSHGRTRKVKAITSSLYSAFGKSLCTWAVVRRFGCQNLRWLRMRFIGFSHSVACVNKVKLKKTICLI